METIIDTQKTPHNGRTIAGVIILIFGSVLLIDQLNLFFIPQWLFSWPMWIIAYGVYMGGKYNCEKTIWAVMVLIGTMFLITDNIANADRIVWPIAIIGVGLWLVLKNRKRLDADYPGKSM
jgi:hypothetical protein